MFNGIRQFVGGAVRVLSLLSGGLDSQLAVCVLREQGLDVHGLVFETPFFSAKNARDAATHLSVPLHVVDFTVEMLEILRAPRHGFGSCLNPCIDCHTRMLQRAGELMPEFGAGCLATGEVMGQRPMSQNKTCLDIVARESGYADWIVRPLSGRLLPPTRPERLGWVKREHLLGLQGRSRKPQLQLARRYGLTEYPTPAGGCLLTDPSFSRRLRDLMDHEGLSGLRNIHLLRLGRHFRLGEGVKFIVGRNQEDNAMLEGHAELYDLVLNVKSIPGPVGLLPYTASPEVIHHAAAICARYSDCGPTETVTVRVRSPRLVRELQVQPATSESLAALLV